VPEPVRLPPGAAPGVPRPGYALFSPPASSPFHGPTAAPPSLLVVFPGGPGIRVDTHVYSGSLVPPFYDSMLAKIIAVGRTRESAILRMERALGETRIEGVKTTVEFCREILSDSEFRRGGIGVGWLPGLLATRTAAV